MTFKLSPQLHEKLNAARRAEETTRRAFAKLTDEELALSARFWMQHCQAPRQIEPNTVVYDSTFWHAIVPEMIDRLLPPDRLKPPAVDENGSWYYSMAKDVDPISRIAISRTIPADKLSSPEHGTYCGDSLRLKGKTALIVLTTHRSVVLAQFDDNTQPEAFGWWVFPRDEFKFDDPPAEKEVEEVLW